MNGSSSVNSFSGIEFVFLDRDGVINKKSPEGAYVYAWRDLILLPDVESAIATLNRLKKRVIVVTNQRGISLGLYTRADVEVLHTQLQEHLASHGAHIDSFYICPHDNNQCNCRKPKTGLLEQAFRDFPEASEANSLLIGDSLSDIQAARNFNVSSILICNAQTYDDAQEEAASLAKAVSPSLAKAVSDYLA